MHLCAGPRPVEKDRTGFILVLMHQLVLWRDLCSGLSSRLRGQFGFSCKRFSARSHVFWDCCILSRRVSPAGPVWRADLKGIFLGVRLECLPMIFCGCPGPRCQHCDQ